MQFKTKSGLVDIPNAEVLSAARDIADDGAARVPVLPNSKQEVTNRLLKLAIQAHRACDAADEGKQHATIPINEYRDLCCELEALDRLPDVPGNAADGPRKAELILNDTK